MSIIWPRDIALVSTKWRSPLAFPFLFQYVQETQADSEFFTDSKGTVSTKSHSIENPLYHFEKGLQTGLAADVDGSGNRPIRFEETIVSCQICQGLIIDTEREFLD